MNRYYATSKDMQYPKPPKFITDLGFTLEYNPNIKMYRLNREDDIPSELMGYTKHKGALFSAAAKWGRQNAPK